MVLDEATVDAWLNRYVDAWRTNAAHEIRALFTDSATYRYQPWAEPLEGVDAIVAGWLAEQDDPDSWQAEYRCHLVAGDQAIAIGKTTYDGDKVFCNMFQLRFENGQCADFVDWYMVEPSASDDAVGV